MIQRWQSVLFLVAGILMALEFVTYLTAGSDTSQSLYKDGVFDLNDHIGLLILCCASLGTAILAIFLYNNRKLQVIIATVSVICSVGFIVFAIYLLNQNMPEVSLTKHAFGAGSFLPIAAIILIVLGIRMVNKDEKLVQSMDRLR